VDARLQRRVQRYGWDRSARHYERYWKRQLEPAQSLLLRMAGLRQGEKVLDVACGTGLVTLPAADAVGPAGEVVGIDISDRMVEQVARQAADRGIAHVRSERMDAEAFSFPDATFDAVLCGLGLMYVPDPERSLREMHRVLRPGGRAVSAVWGSRKRCGWAEIFPIVDARVSTEVCPLFFQLGTGEALALTYRAAGFQQIDTERIDIVLEYDGPDDALGAAFAGGPVAMAYARFDEADRAGAHAEYLASIEPYRVDGGYRIPGEFVVVSGMRGQNASLTV
jgi:ubiquinone/menaquinone biosynthesis C-methylase UbiE